MKRSGLSYAGTKVLVVGLGLHGGGEATVRWLVRHGARVRVSDLKSASALRPTLRKLERWPKVSFHLGRPPDADLSWPDMVVLNPGVPSDAAWLGKLPRLTPIENEATLFFHYAPATIIGVTGTRGKSTTTTLIGLMLKRAKRPTIVSGNIRQVAMLEQLEDLSSKHVAVLELSSFQLEWLPRVRRSPHISVLTNITPDHLDRHGSMERYADIKFNIFRFQRPNDVAVINADHAWTKRAARCTKAKVMWFSRKGPAGPWSIYIRGKWVMERHNQSTRRVFPLDAWQLPGDHQQENLLAATAAARAAGLSAQSIKQAVRAFKGVADRQEFVRRWRGHDFINDTASTSPAGTLAALDVYPRAVFILGGTDKRLRYYELAQSLVRFRTPAVFLPGSATTKLLKLLHRLKYRARHHLADSMDRAVRQAVRIARPGQAIVLSPGAASFGLFTHEFDRGQQFRQIVQRLSK